METRLDNVYYDRSAHRFLVFCLHSNIGSLRKLAADTITNLADKMILEPLESLNSQLFFFMIDRYLRDSDRYNRICGEFLRLLGFWVTFWVTGIADISLLFNSSQICLASEQESLISDVESDYFYIFTLKYTFIWLRENWADDSCYRLDFDQYKKIEIWNHYWTKFFI